MAKETSEVLRETMGALVKTLEVPKGTGDVLKGTIR